MPDAEFDLPTLLFGPSQGARKSAILASSIKLSEIAEQERRVLHDVPLAIAKWLRQRQEDEIYGCLPLGPQAVSGRLLFRASYQSDLSGEPYGLASGVYLGRNVLAALGGHSERILQFLPAPLKDSGVGEQSVGVSAADLSNPVVGPYVGLEWRDVSILCVDGTPPEIVASRVLAGVTDDRLQTRIRGWVTSAAFPRIGIIDPARSFQLVVSKTAHAGASYVEGKWDGGYVGPVVEAPPAWDAWKQIDAAVADDQALSRASSWALNLTKADPQKIPELLGQRMLRYGEEGGRLFLRLIMRLGRAGIIAKPADFIQSMISNIDEKSRDALMPAIAALSDAEQDALGIGGLLASDPALVAYLPAEHVTRLVTERDWLLSGNVKQRHFGFLRDETLAECVIYAAERLGAKDERYADVFGDLFDVFIEHDRVAMHEGEMAHRVIDTLEKTKARNRFSFAQSQLYTRMAKAAENTGARLTVDTEFPRDPASLGRLFLALQTVNASQPPARKRNQGGLI